MSDLYYQVNEEEEEEQSSEEEEVEQEDSMEIEAQANAAMDAGEEVNQTADDHELKLPSH